MHAVSHWERSSGMLEPAFPVFLKRRNQLRAQTSARAKTARGDAHVHGAWEEVRGVQFCQQRDFRGVEGAPGTACSDLSQETLLRPRTKAAHACGSFGVTPKRERERKVFISKSSLYPKWGQKLSLPIRNDKILP